MFFIIPCPACNRKLRFPLDKGKVKVTCQCGHSFVADPDDPELYKKGAFDVGIKKKPRQQPFSQAAHTLKNFDAARFKQERIEALINLKYRLQNFRLLPAEEQRKMLIRAVIVLVTLAVLFYLLFSSSASIGTVPVDPGVI